MSVAKATCGGKTAPSDASVQEQDAKRRSDWKTDASSPRKRGSSVFEVSRVSDQRRWVPASAETTNHGISARQIGRRVDVARDAGVVRLDELQLPLVRADNRFRALVA